VGLVDIAKYTVVGVAVAGNMMVELVDVVEDENWDEVDA